MQWSSRSPASVYYHKRLREIYKHIINPQARVLELGCGQGDLLASLSPSVGVGVDFSKEMIRLAKNKHPALQFVHGDVHDLSGLKDTFDFIVLSDLVNDLWDVQFVLERLMPLCHARTKIILNGYSRLWELPLSIAERLRLAQPSLQKNWLAPPDVVNLLHLANYEMVRTWREFLWPINIPILAAFFNRFLVKIWPFSQFALANFYVARPNLESGNKEASVSIIIPVRNEAGNILEIFSRIPKLGNSIELIFVEGHSIDNSFEVIERAIAEHSGFKSKLLKQTGDGKGNAVREGLAKARGDIVILLDADLTVRPEDLPLFYNALVLRRGEFINGVRLVYPLEHEAMRPANFIGNKFFSLAFSWLLGQNIKDTLCGTKALWREDYEIISKNRDYFGNFDPFGDFDLLFGAAKLNLKIVDLPIRYQARTYGSTNIHRWRHGFLLLRMVFHAAVKLKFI